MNLVIPWVVRKDRKEKKFALVICVKGFNGGGEIVFNKSLEGDKDLMNIRFTT